eukprot:4618258-Pleurochrysis_carterae.AAC.2
MSAYASCKARDRLGLLFDAIGVGRIGLGESTQTFRAARRLKVKTSLRTNARPSVTDRQLSDHERGRQNRKNPRLRYGGLDEGDLLKGCSSGLADCIGRSRKRSAQLVDCRFQPSYVSYLARRTSKASRATSFMLRRFRPYKLFFLDWHNSDLRTAIVLPLVRGPRRFVDNPPCTITSLRCSSHSALPSPPAPLLAARPLHRMRKHARIGTASGVLARLV